MQSFEGYLKANGIDGVRQIADSYDSMARIYGTNKAKEIIKDGFKIDDNILYGAVNHLTLNNGGRVISVDEQNKEKLRLNEEKQHLEDRIRFMDRVNNHASQSSQDYLENAGGNVTYLDDRRKVVAGSDVGANTTYNKKAIMTPDGQNTETATDNSYAKPAYGPDGKVRRVAKRVAVGAIMLGTLLNPFVKIDNGYAIEQQPNPASLIEALQEDNSDTKVNFYHRTDEISQVGKGEIKYADSSEEARIWYGLPKKRPEISFKHEGDEYKIHVKIGVNKNLQDLDGLLGSVKVGGTWYVGINPKEGTDFSLDKKTYDALKGKRVSQATLYRDVQVEGNDVRQIGGSWNYGKTKAKKARVDKVEKITRKPEAVHRTSVQRDVGGIPYRTEYRNYPSGHTHSGNSPKQDAIGNSGITFRTQHRI